MGGLNILGPFQVCDGSTHFKDPVVRPGAQAELGDAEHNIGCIKARFVAGEAWDWPFRSSPYQCAQMVPLLKKVRFQRPGLDPLALRRVLGSS